MLDALASLFLITELLGIESLISNIEGCAVFFRTKRLFERDLGT